MKTSTTLDRTKFDYISLYADEIIAASDGTTTDGEWEVVSFDHDAATEEVLAEFAKRGLERPTVQDALDYDWNGKDTIVFMHEPWRASLGDLHVLYLVLWGGKRRLYSTWVGPTWAQQCLFPGRRPKVGVAADKVIDGIELKNTCWEWNKSLRRGYGRIKQDGKMLGAHRVVYEHLVGKIPNGMILDHVCRNRSCVNPQHLEIVSNKENILRGNGPTALNAKKKNCNKGHPLNGVNLVVRYSKRYCKECERKRNRQSKSI